ncbi:hypothetical protein [Streptococcus suis]|uniref:hypothetical protein n=1 Tax=Streptococcus suis TaxID=1307 RepID=UPI000C19C644|nr:hypothetical protein [Streptococcus suis]
MLGELSIMDWVTIGGVLTTLAAVLGGVVALWNLFRDNKALLRELETLSKEHDGLSKEHAELSKESTSLMIKKDTEYIFTQMIREETARQELYKNSSRAKEILETMDMMKEVVLQNAQLNAENSVLKQQNHELLFNHSQEQEKLFRVIKGIDNRLAILEEYREAEEIRSILKRIESELSEYNQK